MPDIASRPEQESKTDPLLSKAPFNPGIRDADAQESIAKGAVPRGVFKGYKKILIPVMIAVLLFVFFGPDTLKIRQEKLEEVDIEKQAAISKAQFEKMQLQAERDRLLREKELERERTPVPPALPAPPAARNQSAALTASPQEMHPAVSDDELRLAAMIRGAPLEPQGRFQLSQEEPSASENPTQPARSQQAPLDAQKAQIEERGRQQIAKAGQQDSSLSLSSGAGSPGVQSDRSNESPVNSPERGTAGAASYQQGESADIMLTQNTIVRSVLLSGINSDLPGTIAARVTSDIYDSLAGRHVLIPKGSMLTGKYGSEVKVGQERVYVAMQRLILPDGSWISLTGDTGADMAGYAGLSAHVNNHFWKMFSTSAIIGLTSFLLPKDDRQVTLTAGDSNSQSGGSIMGMAMKDTITTLLERNKNISPTLTVRPGTPFILMLSKDLVMRPYVAQRR